MMLDEFNDAYFFVDNNKYVAYVPLLMISSLHTKDGEDGFTNVVVVTIAGEKYVQPGFATFSDARDFCEKQMKEISAYRQACAQTRMGGGL